MRFIMLLAKFRKEKLSNAIYTFKQRFFYFSKQLKKLNLLLSNYYKIACFIGVKRQEATSELHQYCNMFVSNSADICLACRMLFPV